MKDNEVFKFKSEEGSIHVLVKHHFSNNYLLIKENHIHEAKFEYLLDTEKIMTNTELLDLYDNGGIDNVMKLLNRFLTTDCRKRARRAIKNTIKDMKENSEW